MAEIRGAPTEAVYCILLALHEPMHGYGIMQRVQALSRGRVTLGTGTLYGALSTLVEKGWISPCETVDGNAGDRVKEYAITQQGRAAVEAELARLRSCSKTGAASREVRSNETDHSQSLLEL